MKALKIGLVFDDSLEKPNVGVQQYVVGIGEWLRAQGHDVHYLVGETARTDFKNVHSLSRNLRVRFNGNRMSMPLPANKTTLKKLLDREQFDVLHVQMPYSPFLAGRIIRLSPKRTAIVGTFHIMPQTGLVGLATRVLGWWTRPTLRRFQKVFAVSAAAKGFAEDVFSLSDVTVLPNVVDVQCFAVAKPFAKYADKTPTIMFLGRLVERKGCKTLLEAANILAKRQLDFRVVVCGEGELFDELQAYVQAHGLEQRVAFTGFITEADKPRYLKSADIAVYPSNGGESFGIVLIEAMAAAHPVVLAGDNDGYRSVLGDRPELLFDPRSPQALADLLETFLQNKQAAQQAVAWQTAHVRQFDTAVVGEVLLGTYRKVTKSPSSKAPSS